MRKGQTSRDSEEDIQEIIHVKNGKRSRRYRERKQERKKKERMEERRKIKGGNCPE